MAQNLPPTFQTVYLHDSCPNLTHSFAVNGFGQFNLIDTLVVSFKGKYRDGAEGRADAGYMKGMIKTGIEIWDPFSILIDLRELSYAWGDDIDSVFSVAPSFKLAVLVGEGNRRGLSTLTYGTGSNEDIVDDELFFEDLEKALAGVRRE